MKSNRKVVMKLVLPALILVVLCMNPAFAQVTVTPAPLPVQQFLSGSGVPLAGGRLFSYLAGTNTLSPTFRDSGGLAQNTNPIVLDSGGRAQIWLAGISYKFVLQDALGNQIWSVDNVSDLAYINGLNAMLLTGNQTASGNKTFTGNTTITNLTLGTFDNFVYVDGVTFPTIQSAINSLPASGGTVYIPCGTYTLSSTLQLTGSLVLQGCGIGNTTGGGTRLVAGSGSVNPVVQLQGVSGSNRVGNVFLRDMTIQGVYTASQVCFQTDHSFYSALNNVQFVTCGQAEFVNDSFRLSHTNVNYYQSGSGGTNTTATVRIENVSSPGTGATEQTYFTDCLWEGDPGGKQGTFLYIGPSTAQTRIVNSKLDYPGTAPAFPAIYINQSVDVDISNDYINGTTMTAPALGVIYVTGSNITRAANITINGSPVIGFSNAVPAVYLDYALQYNINNNVLLGLGAGTGIVTTANTFGGNVLGNRMASLDAMLNDVSGVAIALNPNSSAAQWDLRAILNTNKAVVSTSTVSTTGGLTDTSAATKTKRPYFNQGTPLVNGDGVLSAGWGTSPSVTVSGYDPNFAVVVSSGTGSPTGNPTVTVTFKDGAWLDGNPVCQATRGDGNTPATAYWINASTTTQVVLSFIGTPATSSNYTVNVSCGGR